MRNASLPAPPSAQKLNACGPAMGTNMSMRVVVLLGRADSVNLCVKL
jgi:hypothetical protein